VIERKTAVLFAAGTRLGALASGGDTALQQRLHDYGLQLGYAFQIADDMLDYSAEGEALGKNLGDDLAEGKVTLPLIHTMREGTAEQATLVRKAIQKGGVEDMSSIREAVESSGALTYTADLARQYADQAITLLDTLPPSVYRDALVQLARFAVDREF
jgi:octaprenyl-diphosphate synthase